MKEESTLKPEPALTPNVNGLLTPVHADDSEREDVFTIITDGFCKPNPHGIGVWANVIYCAHGDLFDLEADDIGSGDGITNNSADYVAVLKAFAWAVEFAPDVPVAILTNSELVANQVNGKATCKEPHLKALLEETLKLRKQSKASVRRVSKSDTEVASSLAKFAFELAKRESERGGND